MKPIIKVFIILCDISAGAGRTGTFIALSNILERVKAEGLLDVFQTVKSLRTQRPHMVQTVVRSYGFTNILQYGNYRSDGFTVILQYGK